MTTEMMYSDIHINKKDRYIYSLIIFFYNQYVVPSGGCGSFMFSLICIALETQWRNGHQEVSSHISSRVCKKYYIHALNRLWLS